MAPSLDPGTRLGAFDVLSLLGSGGMGDVYRARDTVLKREVALKVLPAAFAEDGERLARFTREAEVLASLNHSHIAQIYGVAEGAGVRAIVMELVEGESLAARLARGAIPLAEALPIARQIAEALEAAHEHGVVHRDLKPANVMVREDGTAKVLDFGLAKATEQGPGITDRGPADLANSPTMTSPAALSAQGVILGTAAYMSPEQARGKPVDRRADIWAFGCVLYEMLTGRQAFTGETVTDILAAIVDKTPGWNALPAATPATIRRVLQRCLEKDVRQRLPHMAAARFVIDDLSEPGSTDEARGFRPRPVWLAAAVILAAVAGWASRRPAAPAPLPVTRLDMTIADGVSRQGTGDFPLALSPDGTRVVYRADGQLYVRGMSDSAATPLAGTAGGVTNHPFFSPDGQWVAFQRAGHLQKVAVAGGLVSTIAPVDIWGGGAWGADDRIVFSQPGGVFAVPSAGGTPERLIPLDDARGEEARDPQILPNGMVLYTLNATASSWNDATIVVERPGTAGRHVVVERGMSARYVAPGFLVYVRDRVVYARPFDAGRARPTGDPVPLAENVSINAAAFGRVYRGAGQGRSFSGHSAMSVSGSALVYVQESDGSTLVWVDRRGEVTPVGEPMIAGDHIVRLSPDSRRAVTGGAEAAGRGVSVVDLERLTRLQVVRASSDAMVPTWTADGRQVTFARSDGSGSTIVERSADGTGGEQVVFPARGHFNEASWSSDGLRLLVTSTRPSTGADVAVVRRGGQPEYVVATATDERAARFSPDGGYLAYQSDETGRSEIYVQPYPGPGTRVMVSTAGGTAPVWSRDGTELFYHEDTALMAVAFQSTPAVRVGAPQRLFDADVRVDGTGHPAYDVAPDGRRFLMIQPAPTNRISVVLNWQQALTRSASAP